MWSGKGGGTSGVPDRSENRNFRGPGPARNKKRSAVLIINRGRGGVFELDIMEVRMQARYG